MNELEKESIKKIKAEFKELKNQGKLTPESEEKLLYDISGLLGTYARDYDPGIKKLIKEMIAFSESQLWDAEGPKILLNELEKNKKRGSRQ